MGEIDDCAKQHDPWKWEKGVMSYERPELQEDKLD